MINLKKKPVIGISVSPDLGLEAIQIDTNLRQIVKYGRKALEYDNSTQEIADMDYFKETLQELLTELGVPKGSDIVLNIPTLMLKVADYPSALNNEQIISSIQEDMAENPVYSDVDLAYSIACTGPSTLQSKSMVCAVAKKTALIEIAMQIKAMGYHLTAIDVSVNSILNALIYNNNVDCESGAIWLLLVVENNYCRILTMQGSHMTDCFEEKVVIGQVLGDEENYKAILETVNPILCNIPSQYLYVVSNTDLISAETLANKLSYKSTIVHCESNRHSSAPYMAISSDIDDDLASSISLDTIGAGIKNAFAHEFCDINLFNDTLGNIYIDEQPLRVKIGEKTYVLSLENMLKLSITIAIIVMLLCGFLYVTLKQTKAQKEQELEKLNKDIEDMTAELKKNEDVSSEVFDESSEIKIGISQNKKIYTYYSIVGTEIPQKLWLTKLDFDAKSTTIAGQADNLESIYAFFRNIKDYDEDSDIKLQKLELASRLNNIQQLGNTDTDSLLTSMSADFYQFVISNVAEEKKVKADNEGDTEKIEADGKTQDQKSNDKKDKNIPKFSPLETAD